MATYAARARMDMSWIRRFVRGRDYPATMPRGEAALLLLFSLGLGLLLGVDFAGEELRDAADTLFYLALALVVPIPPAATAALYHDPLHHWLLPWPASAAAHFRIGARLLLLRQLPTAALATGIALGAGVGRPPLQAALLALYVLAIFCGGWLHALGMGGLSAAAAEAGGELWARVRAQAAGNFVSERHAPFLYAPAFAFALAAGGAIVAQAGLISVLKGDQTSGPLAALLLSVPVLSGGALASLGAAAFSRYGLRVIPRVTEEARMVYGGRPAPADPPYGASLQRVIPRSWRPFFGKDLRQHARGNTGLWAIIAVGLLAAAAYAVNVGRPLRAAPLGGAVAVLWAATLPLRRPPAHSGIDTMLALPLRSGPLWAGRFAAIALIVLHLALPISVVLAMRHGLACALVVGILAIGTAAWSVAATMPRAPRNRDPRGTNWGWQARLVAPLTLLAGLLALSGIGAL